MLSAIIRSGHQVSGRLGWTSDVTKSKILNIVLIHFALMGSCFSNVVGLGGEIKFDVQMDGPAEMTLNSTGLGIGVLPSTNLSVAGNAMVSCTMVVGSTNNTSGSNLHISGTMAFSVQTVTGNTTLSSNSMVLADTSAGNVWLYLPSPSSAIGRTYVVKKISNRNTLYLNGSSALIDGAGQLTLNNFSTVGLPYVNVISSGNAWFVLNSSSGANSLWTPANLNTQAWYDAADTSTVVSSSGNVSQWTDKSGKGIHMSASGNAMPTTGSEVIHGHNVLVFDGVNDTLNTESNPFSPTITNAAVFMVLNIKSVSNSTIFSLSGNGAFLRRWQSHFPHSAPSGLYFDCGFNSGIYRVSGNTLPANTIALAGFYCSVSDNVQQVWVNGTQWLGDATGHSVSTDAKMWLGSEAGLGYFDACAIGECIIINGTVSPTTREKIEGYLAHKWGLSATLSEVHPYKSGPPSL